MCLRLQDELGELCTLQSQVHEVVNRPKLLGLLELVVASWLLLGEGYLFHFDVEDIVCTQLLLLITLPLIIYGNKCGFHGVAGATFTGFLVPSVSPSRVLPPPSLFGASVIFCMVCVSVAAAFSRCATSAVICFSFSVGRQSVLLGSSPTSVGDRRILSIL